MGGYAWVTLATNDSYSLGALVLANSLKQVGTQQQLAVLVTPGVTSPMREKLSQVFNVIQEVNILDSKDEANLRLLKRPELGITFTKLHCWRLTQFDKCVFLDADTLVLENCDELFEREELSAAPDVGWPDCFNSGVFVYRPSNETYDKLIQFALERGSFDGGDQGLLNLYFSDWAYKDISKHLPFIYNLCSTAGYSYLPAFKQFGGNAKIVHFIGATKPWLQFFDPETKTVRPTGDAQHLQDVLQRWWNIFCSLIHPNLTPDMTPSHTDTTHGSPPNIPQSSHHVYQHFLPPPEIHNPAENYQNVWDPWEEYDFRQAQNQNNQSNSNTRFDTHLQEQPVSHHHEFFQKSNEPFEARSHFDQPFESHHEHLESHYQPSETRHQHFESHNEPFNQPYERHNQYFQVHDVPLDVYVRPDHNHSFSVPESHSFESNQQNQLVESHNTNAYSDAGHHDSHDYRHDPVKVVNSHSYHPPTPTYIQPQYPPQVDPTPHNTAHYEPPPEKSIIKEPPPPRQSHPRLPVECVATTTVSNDITLHTSTKEDSNDKNSGLAGAFAQLTLGAPRTAEQAALDDHLRRQGWEVGNIDYLGRDSFENIWSKICETLSSEPALKSKDPSPPATAETQAVEEPPAEVTTEKKPAPEPEVPKETDIKAEPVKEEPVVTPESTEPKESPVSTTEATPLPETTKSDEPSVISQPVPEVPTATPEVIQAAELPKSAVTTETPVTAPLPEEPTSPKPESAPPVIPEAQTPAPETQIPTPEAQIPTQDTPTPTPEAQTPAPETQTPAPEAQTPAPETQTPAPETQTPAPETQTPAPESQAPTPETPKSTTEVPAQTPKPEAAESPKPAEAIPETPKPTPEVTPQSPKPDEVVPESPKSSPEVISAIPAPVPETPTEPTPVVPETPISIPKTAPAPQTEKPAEAPPVPAPESPKVAPESPKVTPESPKVAPESPKVAPESPKVAPESPKGAPESPKVAPKSPKASPESPKVTPESPKSKSVPESPKPESVPQVCPVAPKTSGEKKSTKKAPKEVPEPPKAEVTEATPPTTPASPPPKQSKQQALVVDTSVPDTPPPASSEASGATPTPPPRKSSGAPKKAGAKTKK